MQASSIPRRRDDCELYATDGPIGLGTTSPSDGMVANLNCNFDGQSTLLNDLYTFEVVSFQYVVETSAKFIRFIYLPRRSNSDVLIPKQI